MTATRRVQLGTIVLLVAMVQGVHGFQQAIIGPGPGAPLSPVERQDGELAAYDAIQDMSFRGRRAALVDRFLADYPTSEFRHLVLRARWEERTETGPPEALIRAAEQALDAQEHFAAAKLGFIADPSVVAGMDAFRFTMADQKAAFYQSILEAYRDLDNAARVVEYGELALDAAAESWARYETLGRDQTPDYQAVREQNLEMQAFALASLIEAHEAAADFARVVEYRERLLALNPADLQMLMTASRLMVEHPPAGAEERAAHMRRARDYAGRALEQLDRYFDGPGAARFDTGRRAVFTAEIWSTLGQAHLHLEDWEDAAGAFGNAIDAVPDDPMTHFMLGLAARQSGDIDRFLSAFARAVHLEIPQPRARAELEAVYGSLYGSLDDLDLFIAREGAGITLGNRIDSSPERTAYIDGLMASLDVLPTVFPPNRFCYQYYEFLAGQDLSWAERALEIGVGSGVNSLIALDQGVGHLVGTDINENAVRTFEMNAGKLGHSGRIDARLVPLDEPEAYSVIGDDEKFDLIISNPPWEDREPAGMAEYAYMDSGWGLLRSMLEGMAGHLGDDGKAWLLYGDPRVVPAPVPPAVEIILLEGPGHGLVPTVLYRNARCTIVEIVRRR